MQKGKLTDKQEAFISALLKGDSQRTAYRKAYPRSRNWKDENVDSKASNLLKRDKVWTRYKELKKGIAEEVKKDCIWTKEMAIERLLWLQGEAAGHIHDNGIDPFNSRLYIDTIDRLNTTAGVNHYDEVKEKRTNAEIDKIKAEAAAIRQSSSDDGATLGYEDDGFTEAVKQSAKGVWKNDRKKGKDTTKPKGKAGSKV